MPTGAARTELVVGGREDGAPKARLLVHEDRMVGLNCLCMLVLGSQATGLCKICGGD